MGFGLIIGVITLGAAAYFGLLSGLLNAVMTFANSKISVFRRKGSPGNDTIFHVSPARPSRGALIAIGVGSLTIYQFPDFWILGLVPLAIGLVVLSVGARHRKRSTITVSGDVLVSGKMKFPLADIGALSARAGSAFNTDDPGQAIYTTPVGRQVLGGKSSSVLLMKALARRVVERSYLVTLRTRQGSKEHVLAGGLTPECAEALRDEITSELARR